MIAKGRKRVFTLLLIIFSIAIIYFFNNYFILHKEEKNLYFNLILVSFLLAMFILLFKFRYFEKKLNSNLYLDKITGGNNKTYLKTHLKKYIKQNSALVVLEIVNIKAMTKNLGIENSHVLLKKVYDYIKENLGEDEIVTHTSLGEYWMIFQYNKSEELLKRIEKLEITKINKIFDCKVGIYLINKKDIPFEEMCNYANIAKDSIKIGKNSAIYTMLMQEKELEKIELEKDITIGIEKREFKVWFQPQFRCDGKTLAGAEALVRWEKDEKIIFPDKFIPFLEANGMIKELDLLMIDEVCKNLDKWFKGKKQIVPISINLSRNYLDKISFINEVEKIVEKYSFPREFLQFEITETYLVDDEEGFINTVHKLKERGFKILLDDFGVGYSSLKIIAEIDFDVIKIDRSFTAGIGKERWESIIKSIFKLAKGLDMEIITEGIETEKQYKFLVDNKCDIYQGYYFSKPINEQEFNKYLL